MSTLTTPHELVSDEFFPSLIPFKTKRTSKFRYNHRLLIFEDDAKIREQLRDLFVRYNLIFEPTFNYEILIEKIIKSEKIDLILIDQGTHKNKKNIIDNGVSLLISLKIPFVYFDGHNQEDIADLSSLYEKVLDLLSKNHSK